MKTATLLILCLALTFSSAHAQSVTTICSFTGAAGSANPSGGLTLGPDGNFYGTTSAGGVSNAGTVFQVTTQGTIATLTNFNTANGANPSGLTLGPNGNFYGATYSGGSGGEGTVFEVTSNGTLTTFFNFDGGPPFDFGWPSSALALGADGNFYGTTEIGPGGDFGGVFRVTTKGILSPVPVYDLDSGPWPHASLTLGPDGNLYGAAIIPGGTVFRLTTNGVLNLVETAEPMSALTRGPDGNFYGAGGGSGDYGAVSKMATNGLLTTLVEFVKTNGAYPSALTLGPDGCFYGVTEEGGNTNLDNGVGYGTVFKLATRGALATRGTLTTLLNFSGTNGAFPTAALTLGPDGNFYGTTIGVSGTNGTIFRLELPPDFITSPSNQTVALGGTATFSCQSFGTAPFAYQWLSNGVPVAGATGSSLTVSKVSWPTAAAAQFQVVVTNLWGCITSDVTGFNLSPPVNPQPAAVTPVYAFSGDGSDGANPYAGLTLGPDGNFYGTTTQGGSGGHGTVFQWTTNGALATLISFNYANGAYPYGGLTPGLDGNLYGTTYEGGAGTDFGTVFSVTTSGTLKTLVNFTNGNGANPAASLRLGPDGNFYGTTSQGGDNYGTLFKVTPNGTLTTLVFLNPVFEDGANPYDGLALGPDGNFYYTTTYGPPGVNGDTGTGYGTVLRLTTNSPVCIPFSFSLTNGAYPMAGLTVGPDGNLYGTTSEGGSSGYGTVFKLATNGMAQTVATPSTLADFDNSNGAYPEANLTLGPDGNFYGTTAGGGSGGYGTVFNVTTNGTLTTLASFDGVNGAVPESSLALGPDGNFYGTTYQGGSGGNGTIFRLDLPPNFIASPTNEVMAIGGDVILNCQLFGTGPFAYQWLSNGVPIAGATGSSWLVTYVAALAATNAQYQVVVANSWGSLTSSPAVLLFPPNNPQPAITPVYAFGNVNGGGVRPYGGLTLGPDDNFYGTTWYGGTNDYGTVFQFTTNGTLTTLVNFSYVNGADPVADLTLGPDGNFYGTTTGGGSNSDGTGFQMTTNGTLTTLVNFEGSANGADPRGNLAAGPDGNLYGTTYQGGSGSAGSVFVMTPDGGLTTLANFNFTNGAYPFSGLALGRDGNCYGTTYLGGNEDGSGSGTVYQLALDGTLTTLASFNGTNGAYPIAGLTLGPDGSFYGTTGWGGTDNDGLVFKLTTDGQLTTLVEFADTNGAQCFAALALGPDGNFYGTTSAGGNSGNGTVFMVTTNGTLTVLASFNNTNGANPWTGLTLGPDGNFYGTTYGGGSGGNGTIFRLDLPPDFITSPAAQSVSPGGTVTFNCQPFGTGPFAYQWLSNGVPVAGATGTSLILAHVSSQITNAQFQVVVTNFWGSVISGAASVQMQLQPTIYTVSCSGEGCVTLQLGSYPNSTNRLWATTNLALPLAQWQVVATNLTDGNGVSRFSDTNTFGLPWKFYRLSQP